MIQAFYNTANGASEQMDRMQVQGNNIANVNTYGYKADQSVFSNLMYGMLTGIDDEQLPMGTGARTVSTVTNFDSTGLESTGRTLDYTIIGEGFFALRDIATEEISYTRDGAFRLSEFEGLFYLSDGEGRQVLDAAGEPIVVGAVTESETGEITITNDPDSLLPVGVFDIQYKDGLLHLDSGRFAVGEKNGTVTAMTEPQVMQGFLEASNVDLATELVKVIEAQRSYSFALRMVTVSDEVETTINNLSNR